MVPLEGILQNFLSHLIEHVLLISIFGSFWLEISSGFLLKVVEGPERVVKSEFLLRLFVVSLENSCGILHIDNTVGF